MRRDRGVTLSQDVTALIVVFGAIVLPDGSPSRALRRRAAAALTAARANPDALVFASGASMAPGLPSEAAVMAELFRAAGVAPARLVLDEVSRDTLQTAVAAARFARARRIAAAVACSDTYHLPRARLLLRLLGLRTSAAPIASGRAEAGTAYWIRMWLREAIALPYDATIVLARRRRLL
jgi:uncharacterized SAM-binding protein YcdF (DUF218 family)